MMGPSDAGVVGDELILRLVVFLRKAFAAMVNIDVDDGGVLRWSCWPLREQAREGIFEGATTLPDGRPPAPIYTQINMLLRVERSVRRRL
jgi:hypothetical protein